MRTTNDKLARGVDQILYVVVEECEDGLRLDLCLHPRHEYFLHILLNLGQHCLVVVHEGVVLGRYDDGDNALRHTLVAIFHRHLALGVGAEIGHLLTLLADVCQRPHDKVSEIERDGHIVGRLIAGVAEHHSLVAGTLRLLVLAADAPIDILALLVNGSQNTTRLRVKLILSLIVANTVDGLAGHGLQIDILRGAHLAHDHHLSRCVESLDGAMCLVVIGQKLVEQSVANLVRYFIGMSFRDRL